jgi:ABC-type transport system involved in multi-copper enzyme maturation permease subunit
MKKSKSILFIILTKQELSKKLMDLEFSISISIILLFYLILILSTNYFNKTTYPDSLNISLSIISIISTFYYIIICNKAFSNEIENKTIDILLALPINRYHLFLSKFIAILLTIPFFILIYLINIGYNYLFIGTIPLIENTLIIYRILILITYQISIIAFSLIISILRKKVIISILITVLFFITMFVFQNEFLEQLALKSNFYLKNIIYPILPFIGFVFGMNQITDFFSIDWIVIIINYLVILMILIISAYEFKKMEV